MATTKHTFCRICEPLCPLVAVLDETGEVTKLRPDKIVALETDEARQAREAEAKAAQLRKRPSRIGLFFLKVLGFRGQVTPSKDQRGHVGPSHEHPMHHEHTTPDE